LAPNLVPASTANDAKIVAIEENSGTKPIIDIL
jgi:hypothetical protein